MKSMTVFCGSNLGTAEIFEATANQLGQKLAKEGIKLIYGGAKIGLMGAVADGTLMGNGQAVGVIPHFLKTKEVAHEGLTELILVDTMHERKMKMNDLCDGAIALPGGFGTMEELFEMLTWSQLGLHQKPIGILNIHGFYDTLTHQLQTMVDHGFLKITNQKMLLISDDIEDLLHKMKNYKAPSVGKWISKGNV